MAGQELGVLIEFVCDAHPLHDELGPLVTRREGAWAYCAGHGDADHEWRRTAPLPRALLDRRDASVALICGTKHHLEHGLSVPDGQGILTLEHRAWAYCSAGIDEPHDWRAVKPMAFLEIEHDALPAILESPR